MGDMPPREHRSVYREGVQEDEAGVRRLANDNVGVNSRVNGESAFIFCLRLCYPLAYQMMRVAGDLGGSLFCVPNVTPQRGRTEIRVKHVKRRGDSKGDERKEERGEGVLRWHGQASGSWR
jgi:hypothetical protein